MLTWLKNLFNSLLRAFRAFLKAIFRGAVELVLAQLREMAIGIIVNIAKDPTLLTDEEKRNGAFERLKQEAKERGIEARDSILNLALELSVTYAKNEGLI